ncbi:unnamed protein product [Moneuplotes crassus]|uniref:Uncharacterized protein n=1 Tax=Euplotes crassus TaxID=5936 RepID=A0AAD1U7B2_EUPCR|nr:unnamed protein product [Moneuplotes crassus]
MRPKVKSFYQRKSFSRYFKTIASKWYKFTKKVTLITCYFASSFLRDITEAKLRPSHVLINVRGGIRNGSTNIFIKKFFR